MKLSKSMTGFALGRVAAPDITPQGLAERGWTASGLRAFLGRGVARQGAAFADMRQVIALSSRNLTSEDLDAVTTFLLGDEPLQVRPPAIDPTQALSAAAGAGRQS